MSAVKPQTSKPDTSSVSRPSSLPSEKASLSVAEAVERAVLFLHEVDANRHKGWLLNADLDKSVQYLRDTAAGLTPSLLHVVGNVLIMTSVGTPWWASKPILAEELLLKVAEPADMPLALSYLEHYAALCGCAGSVLGTSVSQRDPILQRFYRQHGWQQESSIMYKETPCRS